MTRSSACAVVPSICPASSSKSAAESWRSARRRRIDALAQYIEPAANLRACGSELEVESLQKGRRHGLILTPELRTQHAPIRRHDAEVG